ncbi:radical SAM protein [Sphingomonas populi]|uniref:Radical SAM protein n=1 Tax=Sphingomonas populi TaxID=2484750 RepID=A0A4Q6Y5D1_9SPHN|nr:STM4011 family radical SAM protein [Sphingomonas populi]RZF65104.1 radical SAM protein [Sphingomonas populi]
MSEPPTLSILWRGPLSGCNYACGYCPFAKRKDSRATLATDRAALERFEGWVALRARRVAILFTPWGEALIRRYYRETITRLSHLNQVETVAIQTNLSGSTGWLAACDTQRVALWTTFHPGETDQARFVTKIRELAAMGIRHSVGVVALRAHFDAIERLRAALPPETYLWINAEEGLQGCYSDGEVERLAAVDPLFELNNRAYATAGRACAAGETAISVRGDGEVRRCHFIDTPIGNIHDPDFDAKLRATPCSRATCNCHIGYRHLKDLAMAELFGDGSTERRASTPLRGDALARIAAFEFGQFGSG